MADFRYAVPSLPPDEGTFWLVAFNEEWLPIVLDAIDNLQYTSLFDMPPVDIEQQVDQLVRLFMLGYECEPIVSSSKRSIMLHQDSIVLSGNPLQLVLNTGQIMACYWRQNTDAILDEWTTGFSAPAGSYNLRVVCVRTNQSGDLDLYLDGVHAVQMVLYNGTTQFNYIFDITLNVLTDGYHVLRGKINGKESSSSGYKCLITSFSVMPLTADV